MSEVCEGGVTCDDEGVMNWQCGCQIVMKAGYSNGDGVWGGDVM